MLECSWEDSGRLEWQSGHFIPPHPDIFQNNGVTEATLVHCALNSLYSRNLNVQNTALPPPQDLLSSTRNLWNATNHIANCLMTGQMCSF